MENNSSSLKSVLEILYNDYGLKLRNYDQAIFKKLGHLLTLEEDSIVEGFEEFMNQYGDQIDFWHPVATEVMYELSRNISVEA